MRAGARVRLRTHPTLGTVRAIGPGAAWALGSRVPVRWDDGRDGIPEAADLETITPGWGPEYGQIERSQEGR